MASRLKLTQVKSAVGKTKRQKDTIRALGLKRLHHSVVKDDRPEIRGMIARVSHLLTIEEVT